MPYALLWLESLAVSLLLVALLAACVARLRSPGPSVTLFVLAVLAPLTVYGGLAGLVLYLAVGQSIAKSLFVPVAVLLGCYVVGVAAICVRGLRRRQAPIGRPAAAWPRGKLAVAFVAAAVVHAMTFWNLDLAARQRLGVLRTEAGALAMSVAPPRIPDRDNAAILYEQAFEQLGPSGGTFAGWDDAWERWLEPNAPPFEADDPNVQAFLKRHAPTLRLLRAAAGKPGCYFDLGYHNPSVSMILPAFDQSRRAEKLLALSARSRAAAGDLPGALQDVNALFVAGEHIGGGPLLIAVLVGIVIDAQACQTLAAVLPAGPLPAETLAAVNVEAGVSYRRLLERALRMEEAFRLSCFAAMDGRRGADDPIWGYAGFGEVAAPCYRVFMLNEDLASHYRLSGLYSNLASQPYHKSKGEWATIEKEICDGPIGLLTRILMPAISKASERAAEGDARRRVVRTALAAMRYRAQHGRLPEKLEDLVGKSLPIVPRDPFDGKPLRCKRTAGGLTIYSLGADGTDDGGTPLHGKQRKGDIAFDVPGAATSR